MTTVISPPEEIAYLFFLRNCVAFLKLYKRIPLWERLFFMRQKTTKICKYLHCHNNYTYLNSIMGLFRDNAQCSYYLRIRGRFGGPGGPSGVFPRFLTPVLDSLSLHWLKPLRKGALLEMVPRAAKS